MELGWNFTLPRGDAKGGGSGGVYSRAKRASRNYFGIFCHIYPAKRLIAILCPFASALSFLTYDGKVRGSSNSCHML